MSFFHWFLFYYYYYFKQKPESCLLACPRILCFKGRFARKPRSFPARGPAPGAPWHGAKSVRCCHPEARPRLTSLPGSQPGRRRRSGFAAAFCQPYVKGILPLLEGRCFTGLPSQLWCGTLSKHTGRQLPAPKPAQLGSSNPLNAQSR